MSDHRKNTSIQDEESAWRALWDGTIIHTETPFTLVAGVLEEVGDRES